MVVAKSGGDFTSVQAALNSITDAANSKHYLVWVGPGTYDERVQMKPFVDIEGAGELATKITASGGGGFGAGSSVVSGASDAELRHLTVENTGGSGTSYAIAIFNGSAHERDSHGRGRRKQPGRGQRWILPHDGRRDGYGLGRRRHLWGGQLWRLLPDDDRRKC